jgi:hypothetical protein
VCHLRRFYYDSSSSTRQKMDDRFEFETKLILPGVEAQYGLSGVVLHCGTAHEGHYRALIRDDMQWLEIDDAHVAEVSENDALLQSVGGFSRGWNAYLLFYTRVDVPTSSVQLEDIPQRLRAGLVGEVESLAGLASPAAVAFMSRVRSPEVRFRYFLNTLCRVQETDLARSFSGSVLGLAAQYEEHLKEMLSLIHDCPELQDVMLNVLLSGVSQGVLSRFGDMVDLISRKRETVEWFGRFLSRCCRSCPAGLAVLTTVADAYPDRGDDLSGYIHLVDEEHQRLFPLFANNASLVEPLIGILVNKGASWHEIQRFCNGKKTDFELALTCLVVSDMAQPPNGIERVFALPEFLPYVQASRDLTNPKLIATLAKRAELVFYFGLTYQSKPIRKRTLNFIKQLFSNQRNEFPSVCLFRLINAIQKLEPLGDGEDGKYVHFFKAMNWLASIARKEVKAFRGPLIRAHSKLVTTRPGFNRDLLELIRLVVEHFSVTPNDFSELFFAFFKSTARYSETELRKAIRAFLPQFERTAPASLRSVFESNEFITLTRAAIVAQIPEAAQFITFVRVIASKGEPYSVKLSMLLAD